MGDPSEEVDKTWSLRLLSLLSDSRQYLLSSDHTEVPTGGRQDPDIGAVLG